jgi:hypothetical protein
MRRLSSCALAACSLVFGCDAPTRGVADAAEWAQPHLERFARFDRWARRAGASDAVLQSRDALAETTFAPIRRDPEVAAAWVAVEGEHAFALALRAGSAVPASDWIALRDPKLGALRVARFERCAQALAPASAPRSGSGADDACVLIARRETTPASGATTVTVAFRAPAQGALASDDQSRPR